jgi:hypothetical protein
MDVGPTLIELAAPKGFVYHSLGRNLLAPKKDALGIGFLAVISSDVILNMTTLKVEPLPGRRMPEASPDLKKLIASFKDYYGVAWWRVKRGTKF